MFYLFLTKFAGGMQKYFLVFMRFDIDKDETDLKKNENTGGFHDLLKSKV